MNLLLVRLSRKINASVQTPENCTHDSRNGVGGKKLALVYDIRQLGIMTNVEDDVPAARPAVLQLV